MWNSFTHFGQRATDQLRRAAKPVSGTSFVGVSVDARHGAREERTSDECQKLVGREFARSFGCDTCGSSTIEHTGRSSWTRSNHHRRRRRFVVASRCRHQRQEDDARVRRTELTQHATGPDERRHFHGERFVRLHRAIRSLCGVGFHHARRSRQPGPRMFRPIRNAAESTPRIPTRANAGPATRSATCASA